MFSHLHHIAIICSDYERSKQFYTGILQLEILQENFREEKNSWKLDLGLNGKYIIELFSFPGSPPRLSRPEALGLRHIAFEVKNINEALARLKTHGVKVEELRVDPFTGSLFTFIFDPDDLPIELYEKKA